MYNFDELNDNDFFELINKEVLTEFELDINTFQNDDDKNTLVYEVSK